MPPIARGLIARRKARKAARAAEAAMVELAKGATAEAAEAAGGAPEPAAVDIAEPPRNKGGRPRKNPLPADA